MYTADEVDALKKRLEAEGRSKAEIVVSLAWACFGWPYVFGAWGALCTPEERKTRASYREQYKAKIFGACQVLRSNDPKPTCTGCKWQGTRCFDCRGFTDWLLKQVGIDLYGDGCRTQWETKSNWAARGDYKDMPKGLVCCVFEYKGGTYPHTGMHVGDGVVVHCSTTVQDGARDWKYFAIPSGLYTDDELRSAGIEPEHTLPTLRRGSKGELVKSIQEFLNDGIGAGLEPDGIFGEKTEKAVKSFQKAHGLTQDGVIGPKTWAAMGVVTEQPKQPEEPEQPDKEPDEWPQPPEDNGFVMVPKHWLECIAGHLEDLALDIRSVVGGE